jgi:dTDP-4-amino-4,6-dideoxygalactose transaminase
LKKRKENFQTLESSLSGFEEIKILPQPINEIVTSSHYCMGILLQPNLRKKRPEIMEILKDRGIGTSIYYPHPVPHMTYYKEKYGLVDCPNAEIISNSIIALPVGPHLGKSEMERIGEGICQTISQFS